MKKWICKQHGESCNSYVKSIVNELNTTQREPKEWEKDLVVQIKVIK